MECLGEDVGGLLRVLDRKDGGERREARGERLEAKAKGERQRR